MSATTPALAPSGAPALAASTGNTMATTPSAPDAAPGAASATPSAPPTPAPLSACPATYDQASEGSCAPESNGKLSCKYAQGQCVCATLPRCSGVAQREPSAVVWSCTPKTRDDGCPGLEPRSGAACSLADGKECSYLGGGCEMVVLVCSNRSWKTRLVSGPPPGLPPRPTP